MSTIITIAVLAISVPILVCAIAAGIYLLAENI